VQYVLTTLLLVLPTILLEAVVASVAEIVADPEAVEDSIVAAVAEGVEAASMLAEVEVASMIVEVEEVAVVLRPIEVALVLSVAPNRPLIRDSVGSVDPWDSTGGQYYLRGDYYQEGFPSFSAQSCEKSSSTTLKECRDDPLALTTKTGICLLF
jgi:hypothetical protein